MLGLSKKGGEGKEEDRTVDSEQDCYKTNSWNTSQPEPQTPRGFDNLGGLCWDLKQNVTPEFKKSQVRPPCEESRKARMGGMGKLTRKLGEVEN